jgi:hypothetical protein
MTYRLWRNGPKTINFIVSLLFFIITCRSRAQGFFTDGHDFFAGGRGGTSFGSGYQHFYQGEAFFGADLPWRWNIYSDWLLLPFVDVSAGSLMDQDNAGFIGELEGSIRLQKGKFPITAEIGFAPTYISEDVYGAKDFGDHAQFTTHFAINWNISKYFTLSARFQHMSNGGIAYSNPGLNMGLMSVKFNF